jgi:nicotinate dehydrogenase subunit A
LHPSRRKREPTAAISKQRRSAKLIRFVANARSIQSSRDHAICGEEVAVAATRLSVNGSAVSVTVDDADTPLLYVLRNELGLHGPRFGCGLGQCGACTVHIDGNAVRSCITPLSSVADGKVVTLEGLGTDEHPHPLQQAFVDEQAVQCGYCINGMIMQSAALLTHNPKPTERQIKAELANNLCRCGTHLRIVRAVKRAAGI